MTDTPTDTSAEETEEASPLVPTSDESSTDTPETENPPQLSDDTPPIEAPAEPEAAAVGSSVSDPAPADTDPYVPPTPDDEVTPAVSEAPNPEDITPIEPIAPMVQRDFHDTREIAAAEAAGLDTPAGRALSSASREVLRGIETSLQGLESWIAHIRKTVASIPESKA